MKITENSQYQQKGLYQCEIGDATAKITHKTTTTITNRQAISSELYVCVCCFFMLLLLLVLLLLLLSLSISEIAIEGLDLGHLFFPLSTLFMLLFAITDILNIFIRGHRQDSKRVLVYPAQNHCVAPPISQFRLVIFVLFLSDFIFRIQFFAFVIIQNAILSKRNSAILLFFISDRIEQI